MSPEMSAAVTIAIGVAVGIPFWLGVFWALRKAWSFLTRWLTGQFADAFEQVNPPEPASKAERVDEWRQGMAKRAFEESAKGIDELCQKRLRDLAIDAAVHRLILAKHPTLTQIEVQRRSRTDVMRGHGYYKVFFDDALVATVSIAIETQRRFTIELAEPGDKP